MYHVYKITLIADSLNAQIVDAYFYLLTVLLNDCEPQMPHATYIVRKYSCTTNIRVSYNSIFLRNNYL